MAIIDAAKKAFDETNPSATDVRAYAKSLVSQVKKLGFKDAYQRQPAYDKHWDELVFHPEGLSFNSRFTNEAEVTLHADFKYVFTRNNENCFDYNLLIIKFERARGQVQIEIWPRKHKNYHDNSMEVQNDGEKKVFPWSRREEAEAAIGRWILDRGSPATADTLRKALRLSTPKADLTSALRPE